MPVIDADTHVIENERTWEYLSEADRRHKPRLMVAQEENLRHTQQAAWIIDQEVYPRRSFDPEKTGTPLGAQELSDAALRLSHMDQLGVDIHVMYPTTLLGLFATSRPDTQVALCTSYNRWLADIWAQGQGRLRWMVAPPVNTMDAAIAELRFGKEHGACGLMLHGLLDERPPTDPYFFPLYEEASALNFPVCYHAGEGSKMLRQVFHSRTNVYWRSKMPVISAFHALVRGNIPDKFPNLRWGFIEASASWVPYLIRDLGAFAAMDGKSLKSDLLRANRFYVTCETQDDLPYVLQYAGEDNLVIGSDYGHADPSSVLEALTILKRRGETGEVRQEAVRKILDDNARALYGL